MMVLRLDILLCTCSAVRISSSRRGGCVCWMKGTALKGIGDSKELTQELPMRCRFVPALSQNGSVVCIPLGA